MNPNKEIFKLVKENCKILKAHELWGDQYEIAYNLDFNDRTLEVSVYEDVYEDYYFYEMIDGEYQDIGPEEANYLIPYIKQLIRNKKIEELI